MLSRGIQKWEFMKRERQTPAGYSKRGQCCLGVAFILGAKAQKVTLGPQPKCLSGIQHLISKSSEYSSRDFPTKIGLIIKLCPPLRPRPPPASARVSDDG